MSIPAEPCPPPCECGYQAPSWPFLALHRVWAHGQDHKAAAAWVAAKARP